MEKINYKSSIIAELFNLCEKNLELTMGEILYSFLRPKYLNGKRLLEASDEEIYIALEKANGTDLEIDSVLTEEEFNEWINKK
jgi:hypothetical protein